MPRKAALSKPLVAGKAVSKPRATKARTSPRRAVRPAEAGDIAPRLDARSIERHVV